MIDVEVRNIINQQYLECQKLLTERKADVESLSERLLEKETISLPDIVEVLGQRPFPQKASLLEYLEELKERAAEDRLEEEKEAKKTDDVEAAVPEHEEPSETTETPENKTKDDQQTK